jgi:hypothetical protein
MEQQMEIQVLSSVSEFKWNHEMVKGWAQTYAAKYVGLAVTEENLKEMEEVKKEIGGKRRKLDEFRAAAKKDFEKPLKQFESEVKDVIAVLDAVEKPLAEQIKAYEDARRAEKSKEVKDWIDKMCAVAGLRPSFAEQLTVTDNYTNRTATKKAVTTDIEQRIATLLQAQHNEDELERQRHEKIKMAAQLCKAQSDAFGLATPISVEDIHELGKIQLGDLAEFIVGVAKRRKDAEEAAVKKAAPAEPLPEKSTFTPPPVDPKKPEPLYNLSMNFSNMTIKQATDLKAFLDANKYQYETTAKARVA